MHLERAIVVVRGTWTTDAFWHSEKRCCSWREMERWKFDDFFSPRCVYVWELFLLAILSCKDFWSYQAEWPLVSNLSRFASIFQTKTSDFNKTLFICLHLCQRCTESSLALIPGIANLVGDFKMTTPKMVVETAENSVKTDIFEAGWRRNSFALWLRSKLPDIHGSFLENGDERCCKTYLDRK